MKAMSKNKTVSVSARATVQALFRELVCHIKSYLDKNEELEFAETANMSYADEEMRVLLKHDNQYLVLTSDNQSGHGFQYDVCDTAYLSIEDLIWIMEQIEKEGG
jgi:hypothetical protein